MKEASTRRETGPGGLMAAAATGIFVFGIVMAVLGAVLPSLMERIGFDKARGGGLFLVMNFAMLVMSLLFGPIVDRFGFKTLLAVCALLVAGAFALLAAAGTYTAVAVAAVILGFGGGGLNGGTNALASDLNPERRGAALNLIGIFFGFGALSIPFLAGTLMRSLGVVRLLVLAAILALVPFVLFATSRFPRPKQAQGFPLREAARVIRHPLLWLCAFLLFFQSGNEFTVGGWLATYGREDFGLGASAASLALAAYWAMIMAGRLVSSRAVSRLGNTRLVLVSAFVALAAAVLLTVAWNVPVLFVAAALIGLGFAAIYPTTLAVAGERFAELSGTAFGVIFVVALTGGMTAPWLAGRIAQSAGMRRGLLIPVVSCAAILVLQFAIGRLAKPPKAGAANTTFEKER
jgi:fucose permease